MHNTQNKKQLFVGKPICKLHIIPESKYENSKLFNCTYKHIKRVNYTLSNYRLYIYIYISLSILMAIFQVNLG